MSAGGSVSAFAPAGICQAGFVERLDLNQVGKLAFRWVYWNMLMPGRPLPISSLMSLSGKQTELTPAK